MAKSKEDIVEKIFIIIAFSIFLSGCNRLDAHQPLSDYKLPITPSTPISQTFIPSKNNLNIVSICLRNPERIQSPMIFNLYDADSVEPIRTIEFSASNIDSLDCTRFQFEPVADSVGRTYRGELLSLDEGDPPIGLYIEAYSVDDYTNGVSMVGDSIVPYDLHFKTHYTQQLDETVSDSSSNFIRRLFADIPFLTAYIIILLFTLTYLFRKNEKPQK